MSCRHAILPLIFACALHAQSPGPATFRADGLKLIRQSQTQLQEAYAKDPLRAQAASQQEIVHQKLEILYGLLSKLPQLESPLESIPEGTAKESGLDAGRGIALAIADENKDWQLDRQADPPRLFRNENNRILLAPAESATIQAIASIQKEIFNKITGVLARKRLEELEGNISDLAKRWRAFFENVTLQQYPWESSLNGWRDRKRAIADIPAWQVRFLHPVAGLVTYRARNSSTSNPVAGVEVMGAQWFDPSRNYKPAWGVSALWTARTQDQTSHGYGLIATYREFKLGFTRAKALDGRRDDQFLLSLNLAKWFDFQGSKTLNQAISHAETYSAATP